MSSNTERFTQRARRALSMAQEETEYMYAPQITSEHILVGLARNEGGVAKTVLERLDVPYLGLSQAVRNSISSARLRGRHPLDPIGLSEGSKRLLEYAVDEARRLGHHYIGTEHLLLGALRVNLTYENPVRILKMFGVMPEAVRAMVLQVLQEPSAALTIEDIQARVSGQVASMTQLLTLESRVAGISIRRDRMHMIHFVPWEDLVRLASTVYDEVQAGRFPVRVDGDVGDYAVSVTFSHADTSELALPEATRERFSVTLVRDEMNVTCLFPWHDLMAFVQKYRDSVADSGDDPVSVEGTIGTYTVSVNLIGKSRDEGSKDKDI